MSAISKRLSIKCLAAIWFAALTIFNTVLAANPDPARIAHFKFADNYKDASGKDSPFISSEAVIMTNETLFLPREPTNGFYTALARVNGLDYDSFAVAFDFKPLAFGYPHISILSGGPLYRWLGIQNDDEGRLRVTINNSGLSHDFTNVIQTNVWHTLICSVDWRQRRVLVALDDEVLPEIPLFKDHFEVVGSASELTDKAFSFWNFGNASYFFGYADNLTVFSSALTEEQIRTLLVPRLAITRFEQSLLISWPGDIPGYSLESTDSIVDAWLRQSIIPARVLTQNVIIKTPANSGQFFRLKRN